MLVENSLYYGNGYGDGRSHNLYVGKIDELPVRGSYFSHANIGHNVKSRALATNILYILLMHEVGGRSSYLIDIPNGGTVRIIGNVLQQGQLAENNTMVSYGAESANLTSGEMIVVKNTFINYRNSGKFLSISTQYAHVHAQNIIFFGKGYIPIRRIRETSNLPAVSESAGRFTSNLCAGREEFDYHLSADSQALDAGISLESIGHPELQPKYEYADIASLEIRVRHNKIDIAVFDWQPE